MTAIFSFLGSAVFRWILEKVFGMVERKQDHDQEMQLRELQERIDTASHTRNLELLAKRAELKVQEIEAVTRGAVEQADAEAFTESIRNAKPTGNPVIDAWNGGIRPFVATVSVAIWIGMLVWLLPSTLASMTPAEKTALGLLVVEFTLALLGAFLGWYVGSRSLLPGKR